MRATVLETYTVQYSDPIRVPAGARVMVAAEAAVVTGYEATEVLVEAGASVEVLREFDGFAWIRRDDGRLGWVPSKVLGPELRAAGLVKHSTIPSVRKVTPELSCVIPHGDFRVVLNPTT